MTTCRMPMQRIDTDILSRKASFRGAGRHAARCWPRMLVGLITIAVVGWFAGCSSGDDNAHGSGTTEEGVAGTSSSQPVADPQPITVVVLGSSTAAGLGLKDPADGWVSLYSAALEEADEANEVVNLAVPGHSTYKVLPTGSPVSSERFPIDVKHNITAALDLNPDAVIVNLPSNDAATGVPIDEQMDNLAMIVAAAEAEGVPVWIGTTQPRDLDEAGMALLVEARDRILDEYGERAVDLWAGVAAEDGTIDVALDAGDGIHLNPKGHAIVAEAFLDAGIPASAGGD